MSVDIELEEGEMNKVKFYYKKKMKKNRKLEDMLCY